MSKPKPLTKQQRQYVRDQLFKQLLDPSIGEDCPIEPVFQIQGNFTTCVLVKSGLQDAVKGAGASKRHPVNHHRIERTEGRGFDISNTLNGDEDDPVRGEEIALGRALLAGLSDEYIRELAKNGVVDLKVPHKKA